MTRRHKTLENMIEVAENNGISKRGGWTVELNRTSKNEMVDLGYKKVEVTKNVYTVIHWGTPILQVIQVGTLLSGYSTEYTILHGQSYSDSMAINAVLNYFGITKTRTSYKPVNGGFHVLHDGLELEFNGAFTQTR